MNRSKGFSVRTTHTLPLMPDPKTRPAPGPLNRTVPNSAWSVILRLDDQSVIMRVGRRFNMEGAYSVRYVSASNYRKIKRGLGLVAVQN